jgi:prepilin peptidase CpaA
VLTALLLAACAADVRARRIPNALVLAVLGAGLARAALASGLAPAAAAHGPYAASLWAAALGALVGLAAWLPFYAAGVLGAGDVKLFAAAAAWLGPQGVLPATTYAALAGGALALVWMLRRRAPARAGRDARLPYGVAISAGVLITVWGAGA